MSDTRLFYPRRPGDNQPAMTQPTDNLPRYPGPRSRAMLAEMGRYVRYDPWPFVLDTAAGDGMYLGTVDGQRLFDWAGYYGSKLVGHNHPRLREPDYLARLADAANNKLANPDFLTPQCLDYYRLCHGLAPPAMRSADLEFYAVNSGAEAVENMLKYLVSLHNRKRARGADQPRRFVWFDRAFHGRTVYTLNVTQTGDPVATRDFHGLVAGQNVPVPFPAVDADAPAAENDARTAAALAAVEDVLRRSAGEVVAVIVEPLQGAGGQRVAQPEFFRGLSELAHRHDTYLAFDEVQTSAGATGRVFAVEHFDLPHPPQAVAVGKKFGLGGVYMRQSLPDVGVLDSTWGGNLADMVRFVHEWRIVEDERLVDRAAANGERLADGLRSLQSRFPDRVRNVRGLGLYQGFSLRTPADRDRVVEHALQRQDLLLLGAGADTVRLRPNLSATAADVDRLVELLAEGLGAV